MNNVRVSIGTDIIEVRKFRMKPLDSNKSFYNSIFTKSELSYCLKYSDPFPHLAGIFVAKEAAMKCYDKPLRMIDIELIRDVSGKPSALMHYKKKTSKVSISISHTRSLAIAIAILIR